MSKPKGEKCDTCFVKNNRLRCSLCKWKTEEWFWNQPPAPITISGDEDLYVERKEKLQLSPETSTNDEEIIIKTGQTYGKSANISKDSICEQIKKHAERIKAEADKNPDSLWAKGMRSFDVLDDSTTSKTETVDTDLISRQAAIKAMWKALYAYEDLTEKQFMEHEELELEDWFQHRIFVQRMHEECMKSIESLPPVEDMGEVSDGYHTFNQLYHQRAVLFATIVNQNKDKAWKSWKHEDDKFCFDKEGEWFIVGVDTPVGSYTYHYERKYWDIFDCEELDRGKHWDGHTEEDVIRLLSLSPVEPKRPKITETMMVDGEPMEIDTLSYEVGYTHGQKDRPKGEWILHGEPPIYVRECPKCGAKYHYAKEWGEVNYCSNCGCDCRGDK